MNRKTMLMNDKSRTLAMAVLAASLLVSAGQRTKIESKWCPPREGHGETPITCEQQCPHTRLLWTGGGEEGEGPRRVATCGEDGRLVCCLPPGHMPSKRFVPVNLYDVVANDIRGNASSEVRDDTPHDGDTPVPPASPWAAQRRYHHHVTWRERQQQPPPLQPAQYERGGTTFVTQSLSGSRPVQSTRSLGEWPGHPQAPVQFQQQYHGGHRQYHYHPPQAPPRQEVRSPDMPTQHQQTPPISQTQQVVQNQQQPVRILQQPDQTHQQETGQTFRQEYHASYQQYQPQNLYQTPPPQPSHYQYQNQQQQHFDQRVTQMNYGGQASQQSTPESEQSSFQSFDPYEKQKKQYELDMKRYLEELKLYEEQQRKEAAQRTAMSSSSTKSQQQHGNSFPPTDTPQVEHEQHRHQQASPQSASSTQVEQQQREYQQDQYHQGQQRQQHEQQQVQQLQGQQQGQTEYGPMQQPQHYQQGQQYFYGSMQQQQTTYQSNPQQQKQQQYYGNVPQQLPQYFDRRQPHQQLQQTTHHDYPQHQKEHQYYGNVPHQLPQYSEHHQPQQQVQQHQLLQGTYDQAQQQKHETEHHELRQEPQQQSPQYYEQRQQHQPGQRDYQEVHHHQQSQDSDLRMFQPLPPSTNDRSKEDGQGSSQHQENFVPNQGGQRYYDQSMQAQRGQTQTPMLDQTTIASQGTFNQTSYEGQQQQANQVENTSQLQNSEQDSVSEKTLWYAEPNVTQRAEVKAGMPPGLRSRQMCEQYSTDFLRQIHASSLLLSDEDPIKMQINSCENQNLLIVGGQNASEDEFPHMAAIGFRSGGELAWLCGGSLISEQFVLTAAHCINTAWGSPVVVRVGTPFINTNPEGVARGSERGAGVDVRVAAVVPHPEYAAPARYHDIALIRLAEPLLLSRAVRPACLPPPPPPPPPPPRHPLEAGRDEDPAPNSLAVATGWGRLSHGGDMSDVLQKVSLRVWDRQSCSQVYPADGSSAAPGAAPLAAPRAALLERGLGAGMLCAGDAHSNRDTCQGDSGGPLQVALDGNQCVYQLVGITSFGRECGLGLPAVYTRVAAYVHWIEDTVWPQ